MAIRYLLIVFLLCGSLPARSQDLPQTQVYLLNYSNGDAGYSFMQPQLITAFKGYNNQPCFLPDEQTVLFVSVRDNKHADIYGYDLRSKTTWNLTNTPAVSEYSPQLSRDGKHVTVVRVEADDSTQHLYQYDLSGTHGNYTMSNPRLLFPGINPVGYYCSIGDSLFALFVLGKPDRLELANLRTQQSTLIDTSIGRCIQQMPFAPNTLSYIWKGDSTHYTLNEYNWLTKKYAVNNYVLLGKTEDYAWVDGDLWYGYAGRMYSSSKQQPTRILHDLAGYPCSNFYRLVPDPFHERLALVSFTGKKP